MGHESSEMTLGMNWGTLIGVVTERSGTQDFLQLPRFCACNILLVHLSAYVELVYDISRGENNTWWMAEYSFI